MPGLALILDDDRDTTEILQLALGIAGYSAEIANDHEQAINRIRKHQHCALFMDYTVPRMDPQAFVRAVRQIRSDLPIFLVSGRHDVDDKAREMGTEGFFQKPFEIEEIVSALEKHCSQINTESAKSAS